MIHKLRLRLYFLRVALACRVLGHQPYERFGGLISCGRCGGAMGRWSK